MPQSLNDVQKSGFSAHLDAINIVEHLSDKLRVEHHVAPASPNASPEASEASRSLLLRFLRAEAPHEQIEVYNRQAITWACTRSSTPNDTDTGAGPPRSQCMARVVRGDGVDCVEVEVCMQLQDEASADASGSFHSLRRQTLRVRTGNLELDGVAVAVVACK
jgi:hypothetical protein